MARLLAVVAALCLVACQSREPEPPPSLTRVGEQWQLERGALSVRVSPNAGGRISSLIFADQQRLITPAGTDTNNWGSVLWPSPQILWGWPPPAALDSDPYQSSVTARGVSLTSEVDETLGLMFEKHYAMGSTPNTLVVDYRIHNRGEQSVTLAPWEITRLPAEGAVFFPKGETPVHSGDFAPLTFELERGIRWFDYRPARIGPTNHKAMADGSEGWLAYTADDYLMVKVFEDVPAELNAPGEGEIELYAGGEGTYIELEQQGYHTTLMPGEALEWRVVWALQSLAGQPDRYRLVEQARGLSASARGAL